MKASLHIKTALRGNKTILQWGYCTHPFKLANVTEAPCSNALKLMIRSSSPGVLDGDEYDIQMEVAEGCIVEVETQSYQRLFLMKEGASQTMNVRLQKNASLTYIPHPSVPHAGSIFSSHNKIYLSQNCSLVWGEVLSPGRQLNGEVFSFSSYHNITEIYLDQKLVVKENLLLKPLHTAVQSLGLMEGFSHQATLIYLSEEAKITELITLLSDHCQQEKGILFGITLLPVNGLLVRVLGYKAEPLFALLKDMASLIAVHKNKTLKLQNHVV